MIHERENRGLNLLSLDGGEMKGLSSLLILREIMNRLGGAMDTKPQPWEHFDMIAGSGTGAISAIMLGRLRMGIDDAILAYTSLMSNVFSDKKFLPNGPAAYSVTTLEQGLKGIIGRVTGAEDERMMEECSGKIKCRVAYTMPDYRIWEALRASTAHPHLFKSIEILDHELGITQRYIGGGIGHSNPTAHMLKEVAAIFPDRPVASITSIGTGYSHTIRLSATRSYTQGRVTHKSVLELAHMIAMDNQRVAQEMASYFSDTLGLYYRFDVGQGMQEVEPTEPGKQGEIASHTYAYMSEPEVDRRLDDLVTTIRERPANFKTTHISGRVTLAPNLPRTASFNNLPPPTYFFTGRNSEVDMLCEYFGNAQAQKIFVLHGMGGAGKTQIALKAIEQMGSIFEGMLMVDGSSRVTIEATLSEFAASRYTGHTYMDALGWISNWEGRWLLLFDNVDDPKISLPEYFPRSANCSVLITTRYRSFARLAKGENAEYNISDMDPADARRLLLLTSGLKLNDLSEFETSTADQLLQEFGYLALAIVLCGAYICHTNCSISQYYEMYHLDPHELLQGYEVNPLIHIKDYELSVYKTWELSFAKISTCSKRLMGLLAFLHRDSISAEIFRRASMNLDVYSPLVPLTKPHQSVYDKLRDILRVFNTQGVWAPSRFLLAMGELVSLSIVTFDSVNSCYRVHPLVQQWARSISPGMIECTAALLAVSIDRDFCTESHAYRRKIIPHINEILGFCPFMNSSPKGCEFSPEAIARCAAINPISNAWQYVEAYTDAEQLDRMEELEQLVYQVCISEFEEDDPRTLECIRYLAWTHSSRGNLEEAERLHCHVLNTRRRVLGDNHQDTLWSMSGLAETYYYQRRYADAEPIFKKCLAYWEQAVGKADPTTLKIGADLAVTYHALGRLKEAEELGLHILATRGAILGKDNPDTLQSMANLAAIYKEQGLLEKAEQIAIQVLDLRIATLGDEHPATQRSKADLAVIFHGQGRLQEAEKLGLEVVKNRKRSFGPEHPQTLQSIADLAALYNEQGRLIEAESMEMEVLAIRTKLFGSEHVETLETTANLATLYHRQGRFEEAERLGEQVLSARERLLGKEHPDTLRSMINLATTYRNQNQLLLGKAENLVMFVVEVRRRKLGNGHQSTLSSLRHLTRIRALQERGQQNRNTPTKSELGGSSSKADGTSSNELTSNFLGFRPSRSHTAISIFVGISCFLALISGVAPAIGFSLHTRF